MLGQLDDYTCAVPLAASFSSTPSPLPLGQRHHKKELCLVDATQPSDGLSGSPGDSSPADATRIHPS
ncbi:hypothetical protein E2C01_031921 [Portunus trituberculatus]|uniref:Uncharacterized protein n=1 Tax=Portunus trituberculatus TaxID=210409 RepID=A0A5B7EYA3_PORTR|nr:hypothetical protein [Portunus trituberculatus]